VERLVRCHRFCERLIAEGRETVSSRELGECLGCSSSQVRRDFSSFGRLGMRGCGYRLDSLQNVLGKVIGKERRWNVVLVGAGHLGTALMRYGEFRRQGFNFVAVFDGDPAKVGEEIEGLTVRDVSEIPDTLGSLDVDIGVLAVPSEGAQWIADLLIEQGVRAILSFSRVRLSRRREAAIINVDLATEFEKLTYHLSSSGRDGDYLEAI
jgi:redox-sensing transcriptional repressor